MQLIRYSTADDRIAIDATGQLQGRFPVIAGGAGGRPGGPWSGGADPPPVIMSYSVRPASADSPTVSTAASARMLT